MKLLLTNQMRKRLEEVIGRLLSMVVFLSIATAGWDGAAVLGHQLPVIGPLTAAGGLIFVAVGALVADTMKEPLS